VSDPKWLEEDRKLTVTYQKDSEESCESASPNVWIALFRAHAHIDELRTALISSRAELDRHAEIGDAEETDNDYDVLDEIVGISSLLERQSPPEVK